MNCTGIVVDMTDDFATISLQEAHGITVGLLKALFLPSLAHELVAAHADGLPRTVELTYTCVRGCERAFVATVVHPIPTSAGAVAAAERILSSRRKR